MPDLKYGGVDCEVRTFMVLRKGTSELCCKPVSRRLGSYDGSHSHAEFCIARDRACT